MTEDFALNGRVNSSGWSIVLCLTVRFVFTAEDFFVKTFQNVRAFFQKLDFRSGKRIFKNPAPIKPAMLTKHAFQKLQNFIDDRLMEQLGVNWIRKG